MAKHVVEASAHSTVRRECVWAVIAADGGNATERLARQAER
jgi:hypothetical protein